MSVGRRAYDILRGYINQEWERLQGVEVTAAEQELADSLEQPYAGPRKPAPASPEQERQIARDRQSQARQILGVSPKATFEEIRQTFEKLNRRSNPENFPAGSEERSHAADIQVRVQWAYQVLTEHVDVTEKRFRSLEID